MSEVESKTYLLAFLLRLVLVVVMVLAHDAGKAQVVSLGFGEARSLGGGLGDLDLGFRHVEFAEI